MLLQKDFLFFIRSHSVLFDGKKRVDQMGHTFPQAHFK